MEHVTAPGELYAMKAYSKPVLTRYEDIRTLTMGSSPIGSESGPGGEIYRVVRGTNSSTTGSTGEGASTEDVFE